MKRLFGVFLVLAAVALLTACGGGPKSVEKTDTGDIPEWYLNPPKSDIFLYAAGTGTSQDLSMARRKAETDARASMVRQVSVRVADLGKRFAEELSAGAEGSKYQEMYQQATKEVADETLNGSIVDKVSQPVKDGGFWRIYVLVRLPIGEEAAKVQAAISKNKELEIRYRASKTWEELDKSMEKKDAQRN